MNEKKRNTDRWKWKQKIGRKTDRQTEIKTKSKREREKERERKRKKKSLNFSVFPESENIFSGINFPYRNLGRKKLKLPFSKTGTGKLWYLQSTVITILNACKTYQKLNKIMILNKL